MRVTRAGSKRLAVVILRCLVAVYITLLVISLTPKKRPSMHQHDELTLSVDTRHLVKKSLG